MSEKRFIVIDDDFSKWVEDTTYKEDKHEGTLYDVYDMCKKLNELVEENVELRQQLQDLKCEELATELWQTESNKLAKENEQLREQVQILKKEARNLQSYLSDGCEEKQRKRKTKLRPQGYTDDEFEKIFEIRYSKGIARR